MLFIISSSHYFIYAYTFPASRTEDYQDTFLLIRINVFSIEREYTSALMTCSNPFLVFYYSWLNYSHNYFNSSYFKLKHSLIISLLNGSIRLKTLILVWVGSCTR